MQLQEPPNPVRLLAIYGISVPRVDVILVPSALRVVMVSAITPVPRSHHFLTVIIRHTVRNDLHEEPGTERTEAAGTEMVVVGWILLRQDPGGCLTPHSCRGRQRIHTLTVLC